MYSTRFWHEIFWRNKFFLKSKNKSINSWRWFFFIFRNSYWLCQKSLSIMCCLLLLFPKINGVGESLHVQNFVIEINNPHTYHWIIPNWQYISKKKIYISWIVSSCFFSLIFIGKFSKWHSRNFMYFVCYSPINLLEL